MAQNEIKREEMETKGIVFEMYHPPIDAVGYVEVADNMDLSVTDCPMPTEQDAVLLLHAIAEEYEEHLTSRYDYLIFRIACCIEAQTKGVRLWGSPVEKAKEHIIADFEREHAGELESGGAHKNG